MTNLMLTKFTQNDAYYRPFESLEFGDYFLYEYH